METKMQENIIKILEKFSPRENSFPEDFPHVSAIKRWFLVETRFLGSAENPIESGMKDNRIWILIEPLELKLIKNFKHQHLVTH